MTGRTATVTSEGVVYEQQRAARIAQNHARMQELGLIDTVAQLTRSIHGARPAAAPTPRKRKQYHLIVEPRRSGRLSGDTPVNMHEDELFRRIGIDRLELLATTRRRRVSVDPDRIAAIRTERVRALDGDEAAAEEAARGAFDSGLGMRIQGGRVYDSKYGVTCHWCRQKTLEDHVECTAEGCGEGRKLPVSFCRMCLRNRHGEDLDQAVASQCWVCPPCRGSCGEGCTTCCNCGPCRKRAGLGATHQLIKQARTAGFADVHDFLVHRATGEGAEVVAARKAAAPWGAWLAVPFQPAAEEDSEEEAAGLADTAVVLSPQVEATTAPCASEDTITERVENGGEEEGEAVEGPVSALFGARSVRGADSTADKLTRKQRIMRKLGLASFA